MATPGMNQEAGGGILYHNVRKNTGAEKSAGKDPGYGLGAVETAGCCGTDHDKSCGYAKDAAQQTGAYGDVVEIAKNLFHYLHKPASPVNFMIKCSTDILKKQERKNLYNRKANLFANCVNTA